MENGFSFNRPFAVYFASFTCISLHRRPYSLDEAFADQILIETERDKNWLISIRRQIHENPELRFEVHNTNALIRSELDKLGITYSCPLVKTGIVAKIGSGSHPFIALRADMDALPLQVSILSPLSLVSFKN